MKEHQIAQGVQQLIDRLHEDGVKSANEESERILNEVKKEAARILEDAKRAAEQLQREAHDKIEAEKKAANEMLQVAGRDTILTLREQLLMQFEHQIKKIVAAQMDKEFLEKLILSISDHVMSKEEAGDLEVLVGTRGLSKEKADRFIEGLMAIEIAKGIQISPYGGTGILLKTKGEEIQIDLSHEAVSQLIFRLLAPRYRAIFEGVGI